MSSRWAGWVVVLLAACGGSAKSACELAQQKLDECGPQIAEATIEHGFARVPLEISDDCTGQNVAKCLNDASCAALVFVAKGGSTDPNEPTPAGSGMAQGCIIACVDR